MTLKDILWADSVLGMGTGILGLIWYPFWTGFLGLPTNFIVVVCTITLLYGLVALSLALQAQPMIRLLRILIWANWTWAAVSVVLLLRCFSAASLYGGLFLILQVVVVAGLAYLEAKHIPQPDFDPKK